MSSSQLQARLRTANANKLTATRELEELFLGLPFSTRLKVMRTYTEVNQQNLATEINRLSQFPSEQNLLEIQSLNHRQSQTSVLNEFFQVDLLSYNYSGTDGSQTTLYQAI